jgi:hypothetical protein
LADRKPVEETPMTLNEIIKIADAAYPDGLIAQAWDEKRQRVVESNLGDTLAQFVARELQDTYDEDDDDQSQLEAAVGAIRRAAAELDKVADHMSRSMS